MDKAVLRAVRKRAVEQARPKTLWERYARVLTAGVGVAAIAFGGLLLPRVWSRQNASEPPETGSTVSEEGTASAEDAQDVLVPVRFVLPATGAREVTVAGEFNDWNPSETPLLDEDGDGVFHTTLSLSRGAYAYMFVVDGERWVTDPFADGYRDDGFGNRNAVLRIP
ncbi:MAG: isoamylase early set domain-containing protein [Polyangiales bacterium]|nr:isoamylase early set domain-containing protein [Myxococcales bacterium]MCB9658803.1 isoamylase early set domain-containing protein [Sandaracinaceae bacterium]